MSRPICQACEDKCDWCGINITEEIKDDYAFNCVNIHCDKMLCGLNGCSSNLAYFACCEKCKEENEEQSKCVVCGSPESYRKETSLCKSWQGSCFYSWDSAIALAFNITRAALKD